MKKIAITGGNGVIGKAFINKILPYYDEITVLIRKNRENIPNSPKIKIVYGDLLDKSSLKEFLDSQELLVNIAGVVSLTDREETFRNNVESTYNLFEEALKYSLKKIIHISSVATTSPAQKNILDESSAFGFYHFDSPYHHSKRKSEEIALSFVNQGIDVIIVNPALVIGDKNNKLIKEIIERGYFYPYNSTTSIVHVEDVANGIYNAILYGESGERYIISAGKISYYNFFKTVIKYYQILNKDSLKNRKNILIPIPKTLIKLLGGINFIIKKEEAISATTGYNLSNKKSIDKLKMSYLSLDETIKRAVLSILTK
ncbi:NAD-dependent epimerase/dehydratase family protein [bacterium]|nr:NAD-dependent epimerase/dehydratase family protein [bacterium]